MLFLALNITFIIFKKEKKIRFPQFGLLPSFQRLGSSLLLLISFAKDLEFHNLCFNIVVLSQLKAIVLFICSILWLVSPNVRVILSPSLCFFLTYLRDYADAHEGTLLAAGCIRHMTLGTQDLISVIPSIPEQPQRYVI